MRFKAGDRVTVNNPAYDLHHGISGVVKEYFTEGRNAGRYSVDPDNQVLNDGEFCSMFFIDEKFLVGEKDNRPGQSFC